MTNGTNLKSYSGNPLLVGQVPLLQLAPSVHDRGTTPLCERRCCGLAVVSREAKTSHPVEAAHLRQAHASGGDVSVLSNQPFFSISAAIATAVVRRTSFGRKK